MLTENDFRRIALGMKGASENAHMGHPDFRANGRIFATLHHDRQWAMVKLTPEQQQEFMRAAPAAFKPEPGAWGRQGCTAVRLDAVDEETVGQALTLAWRNNAEKGAASKAKAKAPGTRASRPRRKG
jgi:hypothetical protein